MVMHMHIKTYEYIWKFANKVSRCELASLTQLKKMAMHMHIKLMNTFGNLQIK